MNDAGTTWSWSNARDLEVSPTVAVLISVALVAAVAAGDYATGPYLVFATFYLVPVIVTAWFAGRRPALFVAALAALAGLMSTALDPGEVTPAIYALNGILRFITYAVIAVLVDTEKHMVQTIREVSQRDPLTKLWNRRHFFELAQIEVQRARRSGGPLAVIYIDVDDLKLRNDTYGHRAGDEMLIEFTEIARATFRSTDVVARLGGDEFSVVLGDTDLDEAEATFRRFAGRLAHAEVLPIRVSAGIVAGTVDGDLAIEAIVHDADELMYEAKSAGKGHVRTRGSLRPPPL